jgi:thiol-disulfide isomerase/thioredoxin
VKATAAWCGPCKRMDRTTWREDKVVEWVKANAIAIQVDVDKEPETAKLLRVSAMPTMVLFRGEEELDRTVGLQTGDALLKWVNNAQAGKTALMAAREKAEAQDQSKEAQVDARYELARALVQQGQHEEGAKELLWVFRESAAVPKMTGVRGSFLIGDLERAVAADPKARALVLTERDALAARMKESPFDHEIVNDWANLNEALGDQEATLAWFDANKDNPKAEGPVRWIGRDLIPLLIERGRWADAGRLYGDGEREMDLLEMTSKHTLDTPTPPAMPGDMAAEFKEQQRQHTREQMARVYAALLAAGNEKAANRIALRALKLMDDPAMQRTLVETALQAGEPRDVQRAWLEASDADDRLRAEYDKALKARK